MSSTAELIGAATALLGLGFLILRSVRSITRCRDLRGRVRRRLSGTR